MAEIIDGNSPPSVIDPVIDPEPLPAPQIKDPEEGDTLLKAMNLPGELRTTNGPFQTIDVQPDFRNLLSAINYHTVRICNQLAEYDIPYLTPASLTGYCLEVVYIFAALCDTRVIRFSSSNYGLRFMDNETRNQYLTMALWFNVPPFLYEIIRSLYPTFDARRPNVAFIMSFAAYSFTHDIGRAFPAAMFFNLHTIMANAEPSSNLEAILTEWYSSAVINGAFELKVANLLGTFIEGGNYLSSMTQSCNKLVNYLFSNSTSRRPHLCATPAKPYHITEDVLNAGINPYIYLLGTDSSNLQLMQRNMKQMSSILTSVFKGSKQIGELFAHQSGINLMNHYYIGPQLPTWHGFTVKEGFTKLTPAQFAEKISFYGTWAAATHTVDYPAKPIDDTFICLNHDKTPVTPRDKQIVYAKKYELPDVLYYTPWTVSDSSLALTAVTGLLIESSGIDGTTVPQPNTRNTIHLENSFLLNSAIPIQNIPDALYTGANSIRMHVARTSSQDNATNVHISLYDMSINTMPYFPRVIQESNIPQALPHFTPTRGITSFMASSNNWSFKIADAALPVKDYKTKKTIHLWSSYRWINPHAPEDSPVLTSTYMLSNMRTIYGTNPHIKSSKHPALIIPS